LKEGRSGVSTDILKHERCSKDAGQYFCARSVVRNMGRVNILSIKKTASVKITARYICIAATDMLCTLLNTVPPYLNSIFFPEAPNNNT
jgi:hypothetical protein